MLVTVDDLDGALAVLGRAGIPAERTDGHLRVAVGAVEAARVSRALGEQGHWVCDLRPDERSLEDLFLELTTDLNESQHGLHHEAIERTGETPLEEVGR